MKKQFCHIVGAGEFYGIEIAPDPEDFIIASDGGLRYLEQANIVADLVIGDFDTLGFVPQHPNVITLSPIKDDTDTLSAVKEAVKAGYDTFLFYGCTGGRIEHTVANIQTLAYLSQNGMSGFLFDKNSILTTVTNGTITFPAHDEGYLSIFSLSDKSEGVDLRGLKYELTDAVLTNTFPIGVSNEFIGKQSSITVKKGALLIVFPSKYKEDILK